jgi:hypothetical protein
MQQVNRELVLLMSQFLKELQFLSRPYIVCAETVGSRINRNNEWKKEKVFISKPVNCVLRR